MIAPHVLLVLVAPNVSEQMGGEAMKALQIFKHFKAKHPHTIQITHERNRSEVTGRLELGDVYYVSDSWIDIVIWRSVILRWFLNWWFGYKAIGLAEKIARERGIPAVIIQTEPNSPVQPRNLSKRYPNCFGPINGNIYYPPIFSHHEKVGPKLRRIFHMPAQRIHKLLFTGLARADVILYAGGERTKTSLIAAGCSEDALCSAIDCGIGDELLDRPRVEHKGRNLRFVHYGRLVFHKGTHLIIQALSKTKLPIQLDIVGRGPNLEYCKTLVANLGLEQRVNFIDWFPEHSEMLASLAQYRGFTLASLEDANGIVVQEAMAIGLPVISLNWGGPALLVEDGITGHLVEPKSEAHIAEAFAAHMDRLAEDGEHAEALSRAARTRAQDWRWSTTIDEWSREIGGRCGLSEGVNEPGQSRRT